MEGSDGAREIPAILDRKLPLAEAIEAALKAHGEDFAGRVKLTSDTVFLVRRTRWTPRKDWRTPATARHVSERSVSVACLPCLADLVDLDAVSPDFME